MGSLTPVDAGRRRIRMITKVRIEAEDYEIDDVIAQLATMQAAIYALEYQAGGTSSETSATKPVPMSFPVVDEHFELVADGGFYRGRKVLAFTGRAAWDEFEPSATPRALETLPVAGGSR
jgi:hypothetical protein